MKIATIVMAILILALTACSPVVINQPTSPTIPVSVYKVTSDVNNVNFSTELTTLQYDNEENGLPNTTGSAGTFVYNGAGQMVWFIAPSYPFKLHSIYMSAVAIATNHGSLDGKHFTIKLWDYETGKELWSQDCPWSIFDHKGIASTVWHNVPIPDVILNNDFYVEIVTYSDPMPSHPEINGQHIPDGIISTMALDWENSNKPEHSFFSMNGKPISGYTLNKNWFIRAVGYEPIW